MNHECRVEKDGRKWIAVGDDDGWISKRKFPTKWKAEVALQIWQRQGRVSDYFIAIRGEKERRSGSRKNTIERARQDAIRQFGSTASAVLNSETLITIRRQPGHDGFAEVPLNSLSDFHLRENSGGVGIALARPTLSARIWCDQIPQEYQSRFGHSCAHGKGPHQIVVCLNRRDLDAITFARLLASSRY